MQSTTAAVRWLGSAVNVGALVGILLAALIVIGGSAGEADAAKKGKRTVGVFGASATDSQNEGFANQTIRMSSYSTREGSAVSLRLSNLFGDQAVTFDTVYVGLQSDEDDDGTPVVDAGTNRRVTFNGGKSTVTLQPGQTIRSDRVKLRVEPLDHLVTSIYVEEPTGQATRHGGFVDEHTTYLAPGDLASNESGTGFVPDNDTPTYYFLTDIEVRSGKNAATVVAFGDSISDGFNSTINGDQSYPDQLARRLQADERYKRFSVSNQGISGNRVLRDNRGPSALSRLDRDVLSQPCVTDVIFLEGINDIAGAVDFFSEPDPGNPPQLERATAEEIIAGYQKIIDRVHAKGIRIHGGTLLPSGDAPPNDATPAPVPYSATYSDEQAVEEREQVNEWIRTSGEFDSVIDFYAATVDPNDPDEIRQEFDSGDNLHPNDAGYKAMADTVDLAAFEGGSCKRKR